MICNCVQLRISTDSRLFRVFRRSKSIRCAKRLSGLPPRASANRIASPGKMRRRPQCNTDGALRGSEGPFAASVTVSTGGSRR